MLLVHFIPDTNKTYDNWKISYVYYLQKLDQMTFIGEAVIHRSLTWEKSVVMTTTEFVDRIMVMMSYLDAGKAYLRYAVAIPSHQQIKDAVYRIHLLN